MCRKCAQRGRGSKGGLAKGALDILLWGQLLTANEGVKRNTKAKQTKVARQKKTKEKQRKKHKKYERIKSRYSRRCDTHF